ncbi:MULTISPECIES: sugar ABC transporter substrate-binding protein [Pseudomonas]|jgi:ribose transport system substrate-binding protein|uniref:ABC-type sugar transport system periplasmic n=1 Tax=Pseudomonas putida TRO1 TaxID=1227924 RepID=A0AAD2ZVQ7_PSEPU|nr:MULTISPECIES: sugar ABC transporter substrate-binding protein [Pseudomonas]ANI34908.1 sugar ABC transporter substrate-binding protein [Pseudomonas sp. JY-Q]EKT4503110.1 sugar ABC transporter substrate-binding protein [Pseudomonas putida]EKT4538964.1 sugar ABC transporter substrate-binding protein [Pseudomonas putida]EKT4564796.1 sugar ABC transporter substrate-binding protein [Pseudomonas putida]ELS0922224.1 sugar ABC transporter substrate-binding protein [Pseudomonas putida]
MRDNDCSGISRRGLLGASSAMLALGLAAPLTRTMAAGADSGAEASATVPSLKGKRIAISTVGTSIYFDSRAFKAQVEEVQRLGGTPITLDAGRNDKAMVTQLQNLVTQKPDAVIHTLGTLSIIEPWFKRISAAGIPLFTIEVPSQYAVNTISADNWSTGLLLAKQLVADLRGKGRVLLFNGFYGVPSCGIRYDQLKLVSKFYPQIEFIQPELRDVIPNTVQDARSQVAALLNKYPKGELDAIWAAWDLPQLGASQALIEAGRNEVRTYGVDGTPEVLELLRQPGSPVAAVVAQQPALIGRTAVHNVARYLAGEHDLPPETFVETLLTTAGNVDDVKRIRGDA